MEEDDFRMTTALKHMWFDEDYLLVEGVPKDDRTRVAHLVSVLLAMGRLL